MDLDRPQSQLDSYLRISQPSWIGYMDLHICMCYNKPCSNGIFWNIPDAVSLLGTSGKDSFLQPALPVTRDKNWQKSTYFTWASSICTGLFPSPGSKFPKPAASGELSHNTGRSWSQLISVYLTRVPKKVANLSSKEMHLVGLEWVLLAGSPTILAWRGSPPCRSCSPFTKVKILSVDDVLHLESSKLVHQECVRCSGGGGGDSWWSQENVSLQDVAYALGTSQLSSHASKAFHQSLCVSHITSTWAGYRRKFLFKASRLI